MVPGSCLIRKPCSRGTCEQDVIHLHNGRHVHGLVQQKPDGGVSRRLQVRLYIITLGVRTRGDVWESIAADSKTDTARIGSTDIALRGAVPYPGHHVLISRPFPPAAEFLERKANGGGLSQACFRSPACGSGC